MEEEEGEAVALQLPTTNSETNDGGNAPIFSDAERNRMAAITAHGCTRFTWMVLLTLFLIVVFDILHDHAMPLVASRIRSSTGIPILSLTRRMNPLHPQSNRTSSPEEEDYERVKPPSLSSMTTTTSSGHHHHKKKQKPPISERTLVVIIAETRAGHLTFESFQKHVLKPLHADLALCISDHMTPDLNGSDPYREHANYIWEYPEQEDWGKAYDHIKEAEHSEEDWRVMLKVKDQFLGGVKDPVDEHPGSAGILLFFRWFLRENIMALPEQYKRYVVTRSDQLYMADHPVVDDNYIWVPDGEDWGGITDRHMSIPQKHILVALDVMHDIIHRPQQLHDEMVAIRSNWNLELLLKWYFEKTGIWNRVRRFPRVMFGVRDDLTPTRWSKGVERVNGNGPWIKYNGEYDQTQNSIGRRLWAAMTNTWNKKYRVLRGLWGGENDNT